MYLMNPLSVLQINGERVRSKSRSQDMFRSLKGDIRLLVVRPPQPAYEHDLDLSAALKLARVRRGSPITFKCLAFYQRVCLDHRQ